LVFVEGAFVVGPFLGKGMVVQTLGESFVEHKLELLHMVVVGLAGHIPVAAHILVVDRIMDSFFIYK
jgi:uncharacterized membrane protein